MKRLSSFSAQFSPAQIIFEQFDCDLTRIDIENILLLTKPKPRRAVQPLRRYISLDHIEVDCLAAAPLCQRENRAQRLFPHSLSAKSGVYGIQMQYKNTLGPLFPANVPIQFVLPFGENKGRSDLLPFRA